MVILQHLIEKNKNDHFLSKAKTHWVSCESSRFLSSSIVKHTTLAFSGWLWNCSLYTSDHIRMHSGDPRSTTQEVMHFKIHLSNKEDKKKKTSFQTWKLILSCMSCFLISMFPWQQGNGNRSLDLDTATHFYILCLGIISLSTFFFSHRNIFHSPTHLPLSPSLCLSHTQALSLLLSMSLCLSPSTRKVSESAGFKAH